jgi:hypothetical protein
VTLDTENLLIEAVDAIIAQAGEDETLTVYRFHHGENMINP